MQLQTERDLPSTVLRAVAVDRGRDPRAEASAGA